MNAKNAISAVPPPGWEIVLELQRDSPTKMIFLATDFA